MTKKTAQATIPVNVLIANRAPGTLTVGALTFDKGGSLLVSHIDRPLHQALKDEVLSTIAKLNLDEAHRSPLYDLPARAVTGEAVEYSGIVDAPEVDREAIEAETAKLIAEAKEEGKREAAAEAQQGKDDSARTKAAKALDKAEEGLTKAKEANPEGGDAVTTAQQAYDEALAVYSAGGGKVLTADEEAQAKAQLAAGGAGDRDDVKDGVEGVANASRSNPATGGTTGIAPNGKEADKGKKK